MKNTKKYQLIKTIKDSGYTRYIIKDLDCVYYGKEVGDHVQHYGGACGLLKTEQYPGYCVLCASYRTNEVDYLPEGGCRIEFTPLYDKEGNIILVKYKHDEVFAIIGIDYIYSHDKTNVTGNNYTLSVLNNGTSLNFLND